MNGKRLTGTLTELARSPLRQPRVKGLCVGGSGDHGPPGGGGRRWVHEASTLRRSGFAVITAPTRQRLRTARGHLDAVIRMADEEQYCVHQLGAVQAALARARHAILEDHLRSCVRDTYRDDTVLRLDEMLDELVAVMADDAHRPVSYHHSARYTTDAREERTRS